MFNIILAAGWQSGAPLFASVVAVALIIERLVALRRAKVLPNGLLQRVVAEYRQNGVSDAWSPIWKRVRRLGACSAQACATLAARAKSCAKRSRKRAPAWRTS